MLAPRAERTRAVQHCDQGDSQVAQTDDIRRCMRVRVMNLSFWCRRAVADDGVNLQRLLCAAFCFTVRHVHGLVKNRFTSLSAPRRPETAPACGCIASAAACGRWSCPTAQQSAPAATRSAQHSAGTRACTAATVARGTTCCSTLGHINCCRPLSRRRLGLAARC